MEQLKLFVLDENVFERFTYSFSKAGMPMAEFAFSFNYGNMMYWMKRNQLTLF